jgi:hypothetical protein
MPLTKATQNVVEGIVSTGSTGVSAGSFQVGQQYKITSLGTTTQSQWNTIAGTTGQTYVVGSLFTAATIGSGSGNGAAAVARTLENRFADVVNVKDFGAVGDGVADDTAAIQAALNAANAGKGKVCIPAGTYIVGNINWPGNNIILQGETSGFSYNSSATPKSILKAKSGTTIVLDLVQTGLAEDRTGNVIQDLEVDGNAISLVGIDCAGSNIIERVRVRGCTTAGVRLTNFTNGTRIVRCGLNQNSGWGLKIEGASTTTFSVTDTNISLNTLGGVDIQAGVLVYFQNCVIESNNGPGLYFYKPNTHTNAFEGFLFDNCWLEDNASTAPNFVLVMSAGTSDKDYGVQRVQFRQCRFTASVATRKYMNIEVAQWVEFINCQFDNSSQSDAATLTSNAYYVSFINSGESTGSSGLTATQLDNAIAQGNFAWWHDVGVHRNVGSGAPAAAFQNSWLNYGLNYTPARYWFDKDGRVCIDGVIKSGTISAVPAFTLPLGYRPYTNKVFVGDGNNSHSAVYVMTTGEVQIRSGSATFEGINGIVFDRT